MRDANNQRRLKCVAGSLRLVACMLESVTDAKGLKPAIVALNDAVRVLTVCAFNFQVEMIVNAKNDLDPTEHEENLKVAA